MHPISSTEKRHQVNREGLTWSESVVRRRRAMARTESESESEVPSPPPPPPPPESLLPPRPSYHYVEKKCSNCSCKKSDTSLKKFIKSQTTVQEKKEKKISNIILHQLETKLYNTELEDAMHNERLEKRKKRLQRAAMVLEVLASFSLSLKLQARSSAQLIQIMGKFAYKDLNPTEALIQTLDRVTQDVSISERLNEVHHASSTASETPYQLDQLMEEFREKQKNYMSAISNFGRYLRSGCQVTSSELYKFEGHWDSLRIGYEHCRKLLETEFSKLIDERHDVLEYCFSKLAPVQEKLVEQDDKFSLLLKEIVKCIRDSQNKVLQSQSSKTHNHS